MGFCTYFEELTFSSSIINLDTITAWAATLFIIKANITNLLANLVYTIKLSIRTSFNLEVDKIK